MTEDEDNTRSVLGEYERANRDAKDEKRWREAAEVEAALKASGMLSSADREYWRDRRAVEDAIDRGAPLSTEACVVELLMRDLKRLRNAVPHGLAGVDNASLVLLRELVSDLTFALVVPDVGFVAEFADLGRKLRRISSEAERIRAARGFVDEAVEQCRRLLAGAPQQASGEASGTKQEGEHSERGSALPIVAGSLIAKLESLDPAFGGLGLARDLVLDALLEAAKADSSTGNIGRGVKRARAVLATLMETSEAFGSISKEVAERKIGAPPVWWTISLCCVS